MSNVRDFGAVGDGTVDDTESLQHAIDAGDGWLEFPRGDYRISRPLRINLPRTDRTAVHGSGGLAKLIMAGPGPAIELIGSHSSTADPTGFRPEVWRRERSPTVSSIEIEGRHPEADGVRLAGVMQPTLTGLLIRNVRHALHVTQRARNVLIDHCHIYHNTGIGVFFDRVNLHQTNITGCHISYCRLGGIRIEDSEIRNLQIVGNDIEYNNNRSHGVADADGEPTAEIFVRVGPHGTVREGTIAGNTIQATYSPQGANIRFVGTDANNNHRAGMWTITGNLIGSQRVNVHLTSVRGVTITGNYIYSGHHRNVLVEHSRNIVIGPNCFGHNPDYGKQELATGIRLEDSESCNITGVLIEDAEAGGHTLTAAAPIEREALLELIRCRRMNISGTQILDGTPNGILLENCQDTVISGCTVLDDRRPPQMKTAIVWRGAGAGNMLHASRIGRGIEGDLMLSSDIDVQGVLRDSPP